MKKTILTTIFVFISLAFSSMKSESFEIINKSEETLGELFCFFILETILLGYLLKVNPFDQPKVELIKNETKKILI